MNLFIYDMRKFTIRAGVCLILLLTVISYGWNKFTTLDTVSVHARSVITVEVQLNDTLWSIAQEFMPHVNTFDAVDRIITINDLGTQGIVRPGQKIILPIENDDMMTVQANH